MAASLIPEILGEIFCFCLPDDVDSRVYPTRETRGVMRVCKHWHDVALGTPSFWTDITMQFSDVMDAGFGSIHTPMEQDANYSRFCEQYMSRSPHAQRIRLRAAWGVRTEAMERTLKVLIKNKDTWKSVSVMAGRHIIEWFMAVFVGGVSSLQQVKISLAQNYNSLRREGWDVVQLHFLAPDLKDIALYRLTPLFHAESHQNYRRIDLDCYPDGLASLHNHFSFLRICANVEILNLNIGDPDMSEGSINDHATRPLTMPRLRRLSINSETSYRRTHILLQLFLQMLQTPSLTELTIDVYAVTGGYVVGRSITDFLLRLCSPLRRLALTRDCVNFDQMRQIISLVPSLESLTFEPRFHGGQLFPALHSLQDPAGVLLPNLTHLCVYGRFEETKQEFLDFLVDRSAVRLTEDGQMLWKRLRKIDVIRYRNRRLHHGDEESLQWLSADANVVMCIKEGLKIEVQEIGSLP